MLHTGKQRCAAGGLLRDGSQRERQTEAPLDGTLQGGIAPQTVAGAKQPPGTVRVHRSLPSASSTAAEIVVVPRSRPR